MPRRNSKKKSPKKHTKIEHIIGILGRGERQRMMTVEDLETKE